MPRKSREAALLYAKKHYLANREKYYAARDRWKRGRREWFKEYKSRLFCETCGETHIACLDFHHIDPSKKEGNPATLHTSLGKAKFEAELEKCKVLCANCHRKLHYTERNREEDNDAE